MAWPHVPKKNGADDAATMSMRRIASLAIHSSLLSYLYVVELRSSEHHWLPHQSAPFGHGGQLGHFWELVGR
jgi:hypothetical protein